MGSTDIVALRSIIPIVILYHRREKEIGCWERHPWTTFEATPFPYQRNALFKWRGSCKKGHFRSFTEKVRGLDTQDTPLVAYLKPYRRTTSEEFMAIKIT